MRAHSSLSEVQREQLVELFEQGLGYAAAARRLGVGLNAAKILQRRFILHGRLCLMEPIKQRYSFEVKKEVVKRFNAGQSKMELAAEFGLSSDQTVKTWVRAWRTGGDEALRPKRRGRPHGPARPPSTEAQLRRRVEQLEAENAYLKTEGLEKRAARIKTQIIAILKSDHRLADLLRAAGLARSTYFYHLQRLDRPDKHAELKAAIQAIFTANQQRYGYRRVLAVLRTQGWSVNHKLVFKLMDQMGLKSKVRRRKKYTSYTRAVTHSADNILGRRFTPDHPNAVWVSDVTEFRVAGRKVYLSPVMDLYDRLILAYELSTSPSTVLTATSLRTALEEHRPGEGLMVHTDRGVHYHHFSWRRLIEQAGAVQSMSRKGNCYDNAVMENFFGHLKAEMYHGEHFASVGEFSQAIDRYIAWYNTDRVQERIKGLAPMHYRRRALAAITN